jgi:hypothetical protein
VVIEPDESSTVPISAVSERDRAIYTGRSALCSVLKENERLLAEIQRREALAAGRVRHTAESPYIEAVRAALSGAGLVSTAVRLRS